MIVVAGAAKVKPDKRGKAVLSALAMAEATKEEPGCISYEFFVDIQDPNRIFIFEQWEDQAALDAHNLSEHMAEFREQLPDLLASSLDVKRYVVSEIIDT